MLLVKIPWFLVMVAVVSSAAEKEGSEHVQQYTEWREKQNMSKILGEQWADLRALFPYSRDTFTKNGEPVLYFDAGQWDLSSYLATNSSTAATDRVSRYILMILEESSEHVRKLQAEGHPVTKYLIITNIGGFGIQKHVCFHCISLYRKIVEDQPPFQNDIISRLVYINVPFTYKAVYSIFARVSENKPQRLIYGQDREQWEHGLLEFLDKDQFPKDILKELEAKDNSAGLLNWNTNTEL